MALILYDPLFDIVNANGAPVSGAKAYFYLTGTTTLQNVYADNALTTPHANPVVANSAGRFPPIFLDPAVTYRLIAKDASDVAITNGDVDPLNPTGTVGTASIQDGAVTAAKIGSGAVTTAKIGDGQVTLAKLADIAGPVVMGRDTGTGAPEALAYSDAAKAMGLTGMVAYFPCTAAPAGWIKASGQTLATADYPNLSAWAQANAVIAADATDKTNNPAKFRTTDAWVNFIMPDLRGTFIRSTADGGSTDSGRLPATRQAQDVEAHSHTYASTRADISSGGGQTVTSGAGSGQTTGNSSGTETRPINDSMLACMRY